MDNSRIVFLINDSVRAVEGTYEDGVQPNLNTLDRGGLAMPAPEKDAEE